MVQAHYPWFIRSSVFTLAKDYGMASRAVHTHSMGKQRAPAHGLTFFGPKRIALNFACSRCCHSRKFCLRPESFENGVRGAPTASDPGDEKAIHYMSLFYGRFVLQPFAHSTGGHSRKPALVQSQQSAAGDLHTARVLFAMPAFARSPRRRLKMRP